MPLIIQKNINSQFRFGVWETSETLEELEAIALPLRDVDHQYIKLERRKKEFLINRILLARLTDRAEQLQYHPSGQPYATNYQLSISHCDGFQSMAVSTAGAIGVDIEQQRPQLSRIQDKFVTEDELKQLTSLDPQNRLLFAWCAKEAAYKWFANRKIAFKDNLEIKAVGADIYVIVQLGTLNHYLQTLHYTIGYRTLLVIVVEIGNVGLNST